MIIYDIAHSRNVMCIGSKDNINLNQIKSFYSAYTLNHLKKIKKGLIVSMKIISLASTNIFVFQNRLKTRR